MQVELKHFLPDFGTPICRALPENWWKQVSFKTELQYNVETLIEANKIEPISIMFTPNWNYGNAFVEWEKIAWVVKKSSDMFPPKYNALFVDLDIKYTVCKNRDELFAHAKDTRELLWIEPTWITKKSWWPHMFFVIDPKDREEADKLFTVNEFESIMEYVATMFIWWDSSVARMTAYMRIPNTFHRKKANIETEGINPLKTKLFQWYDWKLQSEYDENKKNYITIQQLLALKVLAKENEMIPADEKSTTRHLNDFVKQAIKQISFQDLLTALIKYPRKYISHKADDQAFNGKDYYFELNGTAINLRFIDGWLLETKGYKLKDVPMWSRDVSFVNNFTQNNWTLIYNNYERPRGNIFSFSKNYFWWDVTRALKFFKTEFDIEISNIDTSQLTSEDKLLSRGGNKILCNKEGVHLEYQKNMPKWQILVLMKQIFDIPLKPLGYMNSYLNDEFMETPDMNKVYIFFDEFNQRRIVLKRFNTKAAFNKYINKIWLHCYAEEDIVATMFSVLDHCNLPELKEIVHNGVYEDFVLLWWKIVHKLNKFNPEKYFINTTFNYEIASDVTQINPKEFCELMLECFDEKFVYLPILQFSAMMLMNVWKDKLKIPIYPSLLLTGTTGKGKTTLVDIIKSYGWYYGKSREFSLWGRATSPQPIKQAATDNSVLFLEELTGIVNPATEQAVRWVINRDTWSTWIASWRNAVYRFKSPILALGQRTFTEDSINNRFVILDMDHQKKRGTQQQLNELKYFSCYDYVYETYYKNPELIKSLYEKYAEKLIASNLVHRARDVVIFAFIMNDFLWLDIPFETLMEHVNRHLRNVWLEKPKQETSPELIFKSVLVSWFIKRSIFWTFSDIEKNSKTRYELHFAEDYLEQNRAKIYSSIAFFNDKAKEEWKDDAMYMINSMLVITINDVNAGKVDIVLDMIMKRLTKATKWVLTYVPTL